MLKLRQAVIVEGKYDKIKLSQIVDATIITTDGFGLFKDKRRMDMIRKIAEKNGIIILTDSDSAGFMIRSHLMGSIPNEYITNAYIPEITGKEKRKTAPSKQGLLGVEGVESQIILNALKTAGISIELQNEKTDLIETVDLYEWGLTGGKESAERRNQIKKAAGLPLGLSSKEFLCVINSLYTKEEFEKTFSEFFKR